jgi:hypothetical protein
MSEAVGFIVLGAIIAAVGGGIFGFSAASDTGVGVFIGAVVLAIGGVLAQIGTIAAGVILGIRESRSVLESRR